MKPLIILILLAITLYADAPPQQQHGPRGGCYIIAKSKNDGHEYKRYQKCKEVAKPEGGAK